MHFPKAKHQPYGQNLWIILGKIRKENAWDVAVKDTKERGWGGRVVNVPKNLRQRKLATQVEPIPDTEVGVDKALAWPGDKNGRSPISYIVRAHAHIQALY